MKKKQKYFEMVFADKSEWYLKAGNLPLPDSPFKIMIFPIEFKLDNKDKSK